MEPTFVGGALAHSTTGRRRLLCRQSTARGPNPEGGLHRIEPGYCLFVSAMVAGVFSWRLAAGAADGGVYHAGSTSDAGLDRVLND